MQVKKDNLAEYKAVRVKPWLVLILVFVPCAFGNYLGHSIKYHVNANQVIYDYVKK